MSQDRTILSFDIEHFLFAIRYWRASVWDIRPEPSLKRYKVQCPMSFRRFVYYCAVCGAWSALVGWTVGVLVSWGLTATQETSFAVELLRAAELGLFLGIAVALGLSALDAFWNVPLRRIDQWVLRVGCALVVGGIGGAVGACLGQLLFGLTQWSLFFFFGWTVVGFLVGLSLAVFEVLRGLFQRQNLPGAIKKLTKCVLGGTAGGMLGGLIAFALRGMSAIVFSDKDWDRLLSPTALGFVALGSCIGLLVGLAQVLLKDAWVRVEAGFRPGREMILSKAQTSVGRAEGSDIPLFGDAAVEKVHVHIVLDGGRFFVEEAGPTQGTYVNDRRVMGRTPLASGDLIRIGRSVLRFSERARRSGS
jgi:hypothetical protein